MSKARDIADSAATINFIDNVTSDVQGQINGLASRGTLTKTFADDESASIALSSSALVPVVSVTKEVPQSGVTNNSWDVNSNTENYTRLDSAYATTLEFVSYDISTAVFVNSFSVAGQDTYPCGVIFNTDGTKMFIAGGAGTDVNEYALTTAFDVSTASFTQNFSVSAQESLIRGLGFSADGTKMYVLGLTTGDAVYEYALSTAFNISTASYSHNFSVSAQDSFPSGMAFNTDGTKMFISGATNDRVYEYALSTGFDVSTASFSQFFSVASQDGVPHGLAFSADGKKMFVVGATNDRVYEYRLSTGFDISTATYLRFISISAQETSPTGISFNSDGSKMYIVGGTGDDVNQYTLTSGLGLGTGSFSASDVGKRIEANSGVFLLTAADGSYIETTAPTSYDQVASGSWSMYGVVYNAADGDLQLSGVVSDLFNISTAAYSQSFSIVAQDANASGLAFSSDGTKMFVVGYTNKNVSEYNLSTAFDVSSAVHSQDFNVNSQDTVPIGMTFSPDGTNMFIVGLTGLVVLEYALSTGFDVSSATYTRSLSISAQDTGPRGVAFSTDGTKMFLVGATGDDINEYSLSTGFNLSTATFVDSFSVVAQDNAPWGITFNTDGTKMYITGNQNDSIHEYSLSSAFDVSTSTFSQSLSVSAQDTGPSAVAFGANGGKMYVLGITGDNVYEYSVGTKVIPTGYHPVHTTSSIDSTYWTDINSMTADQNAGDGNVYYAISTDDRTTWTVIDNTDGERDIVRNNAGTWQYNDSATYASESWINGTTNTELATLAQAMTGGAGYATSNITFLNYFAVGGAESAPSAVTFNNDGSKMYMVGTTNDRIYEYELSTPYDVTTTGGFAARDFLISAYESSPYGVSFSTDGSKMFIVGSGSDAVKAFSLSTPFNISTATFSTTFSVSAQDTAPTGMTFSSDGTKMYISGNTGKDINEYTLSTGFDISTASFVQAFSVETQDIFPRGLALNADGTKLFMIGGNTDSLYVYGLATAYNISTATLATSHVLTEDATPLGLAFSNDGTKMFTTGTTNDRIYAYSTSSVSPNLMDKTQLDAVTDPNHIALGNDLDLAIVFNMTSGTTVPSSDGVAINYDASVLNKGAVLGTDYDFDAPTQNSVRITALAANNLKVRVL